MPPSGPHVLVFVPGVDFSDALSHVLARLREDGRTPDEIHVLAPGHRLRQVYDDLLAGDGTTGFAALCLDAGIPRDEVLFNLRTLHAVDLGQTNDFASTADDVLELLRRISSSETSSLTVVVSEDAGVAGHLVHACLQVTARISDTLLLDVGVDTAAAKGVMGLRRHVEVPLVIWPANEPAPRSYAEAARRRRDERRRLSKPDALQLERRRRLVRVGETTMALPAMQFFWLYYLALRPGERLPLAEISASLSGPRGRIASVTQELSSGDRRVFPDDLRRVFTQLFPHAADRFDAMYVRACGPHPGLPSTISKINAALRRALGHGAGPYLIQGGRGAGGYRLTLPASAIEIAGLERRRSK